MDHCPNNLFWNYFKDIISNISNLNPNSLLGWRIADEPEPFPINGQVPIDLQTLISHKQYIKNSSNLNTFTTFNTQHDYEYYKNGADITMFDFYPRTKYYTKKDRFYFNNIEGYYMPIYNLSRVAMENAIKYNLQSTIYYPQALGSNANFCPPNDPNQGGQDFGYYDNEFYQVRFSSFSPLIEGLRGLIYYDYQCSNARRSYAWECKQSSKGSFCLFQYS